MEADGGLFFAPIATAHSCFTECVGEHPAAPRFPSVSPQHERNAQALLILRTTAHVLLALFCTERTANRSARRRLGNVVPQLRLVAM